MRRRSQKRCVLCSLAMLLALCAAIYGLKPVSGAETRSVTSPDGKVRVQFTLEETGPCYSVSWAGRTIASDSALDLRFKDAPPLDHGFDLLSSNTSETDRTWRMVAGEQDTVRNHYRQLRVRLREKEAPHRRLDLVFRAYNEGAALRYVFPPQDDFSDFTIQAEDTEFRFTGNHTAFYHGAGGPVGRATLQEIGSGTARPLTVKVSDDIYAAVGEARMVNYARMELSPGEGNALVADLSGPVRFPPPVPDCVADESDVFAGPFDAWDELPFRTPWRMFILGRTPGELLENNHLVPNLNRPSALDDTSWIHAGKAMREVTLSTAGARKLTDFAAEQNIRYIHFDSGWSGPEWRRENDPTVIPDEKFKKYEDGDLMSTDLSDRLHEEINDARKHDRGVIVYVNHEQLEHQDLDELFATYTDWGIDGVKFGFVRTGPQVWTIWLHYAVRKAAEHGLVVNVHDRYVPTGFWRTYPNFLTMEGVRGDEQNPLPEEDLITLFTRCLVGPTDHTLCYYSDWLKKTHAYQLAAGAVFFSPLQYVYWYDTPGEYDGDPALDFWKHVSTTWDRTLVLNGAIGDYATVARRKGSDWYVGTLTDDNGRVLEVPLDFLADDRDYVAEIYTDAPGADPREYPVPVSVDRVMVNSQHTLAAPVPPTGGHAVRLYPAGDAEGENLPAYRRPRVQVSDLSVPDDIKAGEECGVAVTCENTGNTVGGATIKLRVDGTAALSRLVRVEPGGKRTVRLPCTMSEAGKHTIDVNGKTIEVLVTSDAE